MLIPPIASRSGSFAVLRSRSAAVCKIYADAARYMICAPRCDLRGLAAPARAPATPQNTVKWTLPRSVMLVHVCNVGGVMLVNKSEHEVHAGRLPSRKLAPSRSKSAGQETKQCMRSLQVAALLQAWLRQDEPSHLTVFEMLM